MYDTAFPVFRCARSCTVVRCAADVQHAFWLELIVPPPRGIHLRRSESGSSVACVFLFLRFFCLLSSHIYSTIKIPYEAFWAAHCFKGSPIPSLPPRFMLSLGLYRALYGGSRLTTPVPQLAGFHRNFAYSRALALGFFRDGRKMKRFRLFCLYGYK